MRIYQIQRKYQKSAATGENIKSVIKIDAEG